MNNPPAFPATADLGDRVRVYKGMTLRDYFAAKAMQAFITGYEIRNDFNLDCNFAEMAYQMADAMLTARETTKGEPHV